MARPLTRNQQLENRAFLAALTTTGNIREACRRTGLKPGTMHHRRAHHPAFAAQWDAAIVAADAQFHVRGGRHGPSSMEPKACDPAPAQRAAANRTRGGEAVVVRRRDGKLQLRRAQPGKLTRECEQAFFAALSATANVRLAAAAAGAAEAAFYRRRRQNAAFAREMRLALQTGYERLELALLESSLADGHAHDDWRHNDPPPIPPTTAQEALHLLQLHRKAVLMQDEPPHLKRRRGETREVHAMRLRAMAEARLQHERDLYTIAEAARRARGIPSPFEPAPSALPDLAQVAAGRKAARATKPVVRNAENEPVAPIALPTGAVLVQEETGGLFGGWRTRARGPGE